MSADPRAALSSLVTAFERHLEACSGRRGEDDPTVAAAYDDLLDAFEVYDNALYEAFGEMTPLDVYTGDDADEDEEARDDVDDDDDDDDDDLDEDDDDDDGIYAGLDDEEYDESDDEDSDDDGDDSEDDDDDDDAR
ncbi:hypothetical protein ACOCJ5_12690 [Knoellia sp. CPCC 206450]|uniref:hypothetical protein n=1 Tax=Knoellia tibetensis TaxID=3404798 RepID=UPI003B43D2B6